MKNTLKIGCNLKNLDKPLIMGILNITPDSFYKYSRFNPNQERFLQKAAEMVNDGVGIFDIGGFSTRPGGVFIETEEEIGRVIPAIKLLKSKFPEIPVSIDTFRAEVAKRALNEGAEIVNDISGGDFDPKMFDLIIKENPVYIIMHLMGNYSEIHHPKVYDDFYPDLLNKIFKKANYLRSKGVKDIVIDPGIGFSKSISQNFSLVQNSSVLLNPEYPILIGVSRKSMIYKTLKKDSEHVLTESVFLNGLAAISGVKILRTHDVKELYEILKIIKMLEVN